MWNALLFKYGLAFVGSLVVSLLSIPNIIYVAKRKRLFDVPDNHRKLHTRIVPNLGGIGIFFGFIIVATLLISPTVFPKWNYIVVASLILFLVGIKDDLVNISPTKKFAAQFAAAFITAYFAKIRIESLHGLFGIQGLPEWASITFTIIGCMFVTNAFNLIDGIDGLAGTIGVIASFTLGTCLAAAGQVSGAIIAFSLMGAIIGFLRYNIAPAKIFMGDTGSLLIGFVLCIIGILFLNSAPKEHTLFRQVVAKPSVLMVIALSILFIPIFDTFRVFTTRLLKGRSPFSADRTHLHHYLLDLGLTHTQTVGVLATANILIIVVCGFVQHYDIHFAIASLFFVAFGLFAIVFFMRRSRLAHMSLAGGNSSLISADDEPQQDETFAKKEAALIPEPGPKQSKGGNAAVQHLTVNGHRIHVEVPLDADANA